MRFFDFSAVRPIKTAPSGVVATGSGMRKNKKWTRAIRAHFSSRNRDIAIFRSLCSGSF